MPILSNLLDALNPQPPAPTPRQQQLSSTLGKSSFSAIRIDTKSINFKQIATSTNRHSSLFAYPSNPKTVSTPDSAFSTKTSAENAYLVPKTLEECFASGLLRLLLWELRDDPFTGDLEAWRGWYTVWHIPRIGKFYLLKLKNQDGEGSGGYVDVPSVEERDANFWFRREMQDIRKALVDRFGE